MARFSCTNCGYSIEYSHPSESALSCPGCRHRLETDDDFESEIQEHEHIFFEELMSGRTAEQSHPDEPADQSGYSVAPSLTEQTDSKRVLSGIPDGVPAVQWRYTPRFEGSAAGYFSIWIVNVLFSVVTLGIFMVWGKKRVRRYFLNTVVIDNKPLVSVKDGSVVYERIRGAQQKNIRAYDITIESTAKALTLFWIRVSNILACICSLGLLIPWAKIRRFRYLTENSTIVSKQRIL